VRQKAAALFLKKAKSQSEKEHGEEVGEFVNMGFVIDLPNLWAKDYCSFIYTN